MGVPIEEHAGKEVENKVVGQDSFKVGGIYRRHLIREDEENEVGNWFVVLDFWKDDLGKWCKVYDLEDGDVEEYSLRDLGVLPYGENNWHENSCVQKHPELSLSPKYLRGQNPITKLVRFLFG